MGLAGRCAWQPADRMTGPAYGLVCLTTGPEIRFRTITLTRYRALNPDQRYGTLLELAWTEHGDRKPLDAYYWHFLVEVVDRVCKRWQ